MAYAQRFIQRDTKMRETNPYVAALVRKLTLEHTINSLEEMHRSLLAANEHEHSLTFNKAKLRAYYACKQKDKAKCRLAIDAYMEVAGEMLQLAMDGKIDSFGMYGAQQSYSGDNAKDENARQMAESMKNTFEFLEYFYDDM